MTGSGTDLLEGRTHACNYRNIEFRPSGKWRGRLHHGGKMLHAGNFDTPDAAAHAVDRILYKIGRQAELQTEVSPAEKGVLDRMTLEEVLRECQAPGRAAKKARGSSKYQGVSAAGNAWRACLQKAHRQIPCGCYSTEFAAARARDCALVLSDLGTICKSRVELNFPREDYEAAAQIRTDYLEGRTYKVPDSWFLSEERVKLILKRMNDSKLADCTDGALENEDSAPQRPSAPKRPKKRQKTLSSIETDTLNNGFPRDCSESDRLESDWSSLEGENSCSTDCEGPAGNSLYGAGSLHNQDLHKTKPYPLSIPDGGLGLPTDEDDLQEEFDAAMEDPHYAEAMHRRVIKGSTLPNLHIFQMPVNQNYIDEIWPPPKQRKPWDRVKALCHLCPDMEEFLSEEEEGDDKVYDFYIHKKEANVASTQKARPALGMKIRIQEAAKAVNFKTTFGIDRKDVEVLTPEMENHGPWYDALMNPGPDYVPSSAEKELMDQIDLYTEAARNKWKSELLCRTFAEKTREVICAVVNSRRRDYRERRLKEAADARQRREHFCKPWVQEAAEKTLYKKIIDEAFREGSGPYER